MPRYLRLIIPSFLRDNDKLAFYAVEADKRLSQFDLDVASASCKKVFISDSILENEDIPDLSQLQNKITKYNQICFH